MATISLFYGKTFESVCLGAEKVVKNCRLHLKHGFAPIVEEEEEEEMEREEKRLGMDEEKVIQPLVQSSPSHCLLHPAEPVRRGRMTFLKWYWIAMLEASNLEIIEEEDEEENKEEESNIDVAEPLDVCTSDQRCANAGQAHTISFTDDTQQQQVSDNYDCIKNYIIMLSIINI